MFTKLTSEQLNKALTEINIWDESPYVALSDIERFYNVLGGSVILSIHEEYPSVPHATIENGIDKDFIIEWTSETKSALLMIEFGCTKSIISCTDKLTKTNIEEKFSLADIQDMLRIKDTVIAFFSD